jgi:hypothetical protein
MFLGPDFTQHGASPAGGAFAHPPTNDADSDIDLSRANLPSKPAYAAAIACVTLIGSFNTLHSAFRFSARGRQ